MPSTSPAPAADAQLCASKPAPPPAVPGFEDYGLNYTFLFRVYLALSLIAAGLFCGQYYANFTSITGFWLVPAPAALALPVIFFMSRSQVAAGLPAASADALAAVAARDEAAKKNQ